MATVDERAKLLSIACPWCRAKPGEDCTTGKDRDGKRRPVTTLDAGCHDARWQAALGYEASVIGAAVEARVPVRHAVNEEREPQLVGAGIGSALPERPW